MRPVLHRPLDGPMKNLTVSKTRNGKYFVSIQIEVEMAVPVFVGGRPVGLDLGLREFATLSTGERIVPPDPTARRKRNGAACPSTISEEVRQPKP